jgi:hypothetical protein
MLLLIDVSIANSLLTDHIITIDTVIIIYVFKNQAVRNIKSYTFIDNINLKQILR